MAEHRPGVPAWRVSASAARSWPLAFASALHQDVEHDTDRDLLALNLIVEADDAAVRSKDGLARGGEKHLVRRHVKRGPLIIQRDGAR